MLHAVTEIDFDLRLGKREDHVVLPLVQLVDLLDHHRHILQRLGVLALAGAGIVGQLFQPPALGLQRADEFAQVVVEDDRDRVAAIPVHVDQRVERPLGAGEHPVDRALPVALHMVGVEILGEVFADVLAQGVLDGAQVLAEMVLAEGHAEEQAEAFGDVVGEPVGVEHGDDVVLVRHEGGVRHAGEVILQPFALIGEDQARRVEAVAAEHAAHGVGEEVSNYVFIRGQCV